MMMMKIMNTLLFYFVKSEKVSNIRQNQKRSNKTDVTTFLKMLTDPESCLIHLKENYTKAGHPISYAGQNTLYKFYNGILSLNKIRDFLITNFAHNLHLETKKGPTNPTFKYFKRFQWQCDICEISSVAHLNSSYKYLFCVIDIFSR